MIRLGRITDEAKDGTVQEQFSAEKEACACLLCTWWQIAADAQYSNAFIVQWMQKDAQQHGVPLVQAARLWAFLLRWFGVRLMRHSRAALCFWSWLKCRRLMITLLHYCISI